MARVYKRKVSYSQGSIDEKTGLSVKVSDLLAIVSVAFIAAAAWYLYYKQYFIGLTLNDAMDYAGIARNVVEGEGFISQYVTPLGMVHHGVPQPDMWRSPLWPLALAVFQKIFGFIDEASALGTGFFFVVTAPLIFLLARRLFDNVVAAGSVLLYISSPQLLYYSISGMTESMAVFFMALMFLVLASPAADNRAGDVLLGVVAGVFYLARYNALLFLPFIVFFRVYQGKKPGLGTAVRVVAGFLLAALPWLIRNAVLFGNPLFSLQKYEPAMFTGTYPDYVMYVLPEKINVAGFMMNNSNEIMDKVVSGWHEFLSMAGSQEFWGVVPLILILFLLPVFLIDKRAALYKSLLALLFTVQLAALLVIHFIPRLFLIFTPLYIILGLGSLITVLYFLVGYARSVALRNGLRLFLGLAVICGTGVSGVWNFSVNQPEVPERIRFPLAIIELSKTTAEGDLVMTNEGHMVSWYGNRYAVKIPYSMEMIPEIEKISPVKALFISSRIFWHMPEVKNEWKSILYKRPERIYDFRLYKVFPDDSVLYLKGPVN